MANNAKKAFAYLRTSSAANVGNDKDSAKRQLVAITEYAKRAGIAIDDKFYDTAVSGADPIAERAGFAEMLTRIAGNGVRMILVETASRFARDLMVQEVGFTMLRDLGIELVAVDSPSAFLDDGPTAVLIRQILGAVAQFDKTMTVAKLKGARDRKRATGVKVEGRKAIHEREGGAAIVELAKRLHRKSPKTGKRRSLRDIADELARAGHVAASGKPLSPTVVSRLVA